MNRGLLISGLLGGAVLAVPPASLADGDNYASGFLTRGVDAAADIDQGSVAGDPFYVAAKTGALLPRVSLSLVHDDNVLLDSSNETANTSISLVPGLLGIWGRPAGNHLFADYGLILPVYESERELEDRPSHLLRLGGVYQTGKSQIQVQLGHRRLEDVDTVVGARVAKRDWTGDLGAEHRISGKSSLGVQGRLERHEFDAAGYVDYDRYYGAGRIYHRVSPKSQMFLQGGVGRDDPRAAADDTVAADFADLSLGLRGKQSPRFNAAGRFGYMWRAYDAEDRGHYGHWIASVRAESTPFGLTLFSGELNADIRPAIDSRSIDTVDQNVVLGATRRLFNERLRGNVSATLGQIEYAGAGTEGEPVSDGRTDRYWGFSIGVDWWARARFSVGAAYAYMRRDGSVDGDGEEQDATSYETGRWTLRASWNY